MDHQERNIVDHFEVLSLSHRAALKEEVLHQAYADKSRIAHPDHGGSEQHATEVNAAYEALRSPETRLKHLLELSVPEQAKAWRTVPLDEGMMQLFSQLGAALESSGKFLERKSKAQSALAKALLTNEEMRHRETLEAIGTAIAEYRAAMESELPTMDSELESASDVTWRKLAAMQARFAYLGRWQTQIRERLLQLM
ncbi:MAG: hypothetical protein RL693_2174 [Verrucomicrobiota bacterium]|jgi:curved DNA-binding protein CbpA